MPSFLPKTLLLFCCMLVAFAETLTPSGSSPETSAAWVPAEGPPDVLYQTVEELRSFYKLTAGTRSSRKGGYSLTHADTSVELGPGARELRINGVDITLARPFMRDPDGKLLISREDWVYWIDPILRPLYIANRSAVDTVVIDAAHGGHDTGVACAANSEAQITLLTAQALRVELEKAGLRCFLTRTDDYFLSDRQRVDNSNSTPNAIFVSLHINSSNAAAEGPMVYVLSPSSIAQTERPGETFACKSAALAYALQYALSSETRSSGGGCRHTHYNLLSSLSMPAVSIELGYASNAKEAAALCTPEYRSRLVSAIARGILNYTRATAPTATMPVMPSAPKKTTVQKDATREKLPNTKAKPDSSPDKRRNRRPRRKR